MAEIIDLSSVNEYTHINVFISCLIARIFLQQQIVLFKKTIQITSNDFY